MEPLGRKPPELPEAEWLEAVNSRYWMNCSICRLPCGKFAVYGQSWTVLAVLTWQELTEYTRGLREPDKSRSPSRSATTPASKELLNKLIGAWAWRN